MRVSIMSMQRIANYGSFLQAYALKKTIETLGHQVDFADYRVQPCLIQPQKVEQGKDTYVKDKAFRLINAIKCFAYKIPFDQHKQFYQNYSGKYLQIIGVSDERRERPDTDVLVIGSDEVFNCVQSNPDVGCSMELFGKDSRAKKIISYAASFGNTGIKELKRFDVQDEIAELLKKFTAISVRDKNSEAIVKELMGKMPQKHLDPVLIYDYTKEVTSCTCYMPFERYMVVYAYSSRITKQEGKEIKRFAKKNGLKLIAIGGEHSFCDVSIYPKPFEVLSIIKNAAYVVTDTFHGTVFSIKYNKQFGTLIRKGNGEKYGNYEKLNDLLSTFNLNDREIKEISDLDFILNSKIDYKSVNEIIAVNRKNTLEYLKSNI